ncbi:alpha-amylase [candidate division KSB1 bacterium]|nr:alpha-amylase [candidate division KSB1 bacterium]
MPLTSIEKFGIIKHERSFGELESIISPDWAYDAIIYEIYLRAFSKEGDIVSLTKRIPELKDLGINVIWLMPIHLIGHLKRKGPLGSPYSIRDFYRINSEYGSKDDFKALVNECHVNDIRLVLDFVANHAANDHIEIKNHPDWFMHDDEGNFSRQIAGWSDVVDLNYNNKELRKYIKDVAHYWVENFDIDGYRCDVAGLVPDDFWSDLVQDLKKVKHDLLMIAEWEDPEMHLKSFNVTYDWVLYYKLDELQNGLVNAQDVVDLVFDRKMHFPRNALRLRFLENHDQARATYKFGAGSYKPYATLIFTLDGIPMLYNGQEVGDPKHLTLFDKNPINWKVRGANDFKKLYKTLIQLRLDHEVMTKGSLFKIENNNPQYIASYGRKLDDKYAIIMLNFGAIESQVTLQADFQVDNWQILNINQLETFNFSTDKLKFSLKPYDGYILLS